MKDPLRIENDYYVLEVDPRNGALGRIYDKGGGLELLAHDRLADSFRLLLPLPDMEANYILGPDQRLTSSDVTTDTLVLRWDGPLTNPRGSFALSVIVRIALEGEAIAFRIEVDNRTSHKLAEVWHAGLGGLLGIGDRSTTRTTLPKLRGPDTEWLFRHFPESMGVGSGGGMRFPEYYAQYPREIGMPWLDLHNADANRGMYYACHDPVSRVSTLRFEMHPGLARNRLSGNWPSDQEIAAMSDQYPPGLVVHWVHFPYTPPGETFVGPTVVLRSHEGDWHRAAAFYRAWFRSRFVVRQPDEGWLRQQQAVQDAMFLLPEGNVMLTFREMPRWAKDARDYGVKTVMVSGWNVGGHDNQYPNYTPDSRLGTWEDLAEAIATCHDLGMRVLFFANIQSVDVSTDWFREELHQYRMMDARGSTNVAGWGMGTLGARMGLTRPPVGGCDPAFPGFRKIIVDHMRKLAEIGADGIHFDKVIGMPPVDYNPALDLPPDQAWYTGVIRCLEEVLTSCRAIRPDFCLSVESPWDRLLSYCDAWWLWHDTLDHVPVMKFTFPEFLPTFAVVQPWDYNNVNNAIRYGYQILVGPVRYSASMRDEQSRPISTYIADVLRIREELKDTIFTGEFLDTLEASVKGPEHLRFTVHRNRETGKRACVLVNQSEAELEATLAFDGNPTGSVRVYRPFSAVERQASPVTLSIPGERLALVVEE